MKQVITWDQFFSLTEKLATLIEKDTVHKYKSILCIADGGLILGRLLKTRLHLPLSIIKYTHYEGDVPHSRSVSPVIGQIQFPVLIVDELADHGTTLLEVLKHLTKSSKQVGIAVIWDKEIARQSLKKYKLYSVKHSHSRHWLVMPWE